MEENPTVQPHFADFGLTSAPNETNAAKATVQRLFGRSQGILGQIRRLASNDLKLPLKCGKTALHKGFPRHLQAILPLNTDKASNKRRIAQITPSAHCYASKRRILRAFPRLFEHFGKPRYTSADILPSSGAISSRFCPVSPWLDDTALSRRILNFPHFPDGQSVPNDKKQFQILFAAFQPVFRLLLTLTSCLGSPTRFRAADCPSKAPGFACAVACVINRRIFESTFLKNALFYRTD